MRGIRDEYQGNAPVLKIMVESLSIKRRFAGDLAVISLKADIKKHTKYRRANTLETTNL